LVLASQGNARFWWRALMWRDGNLPVAACKPYRQGRARRGSFAPALRVEMPAQQA